MPSLTILRNPARNRRSDFADSLPPFSTEEPVRRAGNDTRLKSKVRPTRQRRSTMGQARSMIGRAEATDRLLTPTLLEPGLIPIVKIEKHFAQVPPMRAEGVHRLCLGDQRIVGLKMLDDSPG